MRNERRVVVLACVMAACCLAQGAARAGETKAAELTRIEAETAVLKAVARKTEVQAQIAGKQVEIAARRAETRRHEAVPPSDVPVLRGVEGVGDRMVATLQLPNRSPVDLAAGQSLPNGVKVVSIHANEVVVETPAKQRVRLVGAADNAPAVATPRSPGLPPLGLPPLPELPGGALQ